MPDAHITSGRSVLFEIWIGFRPYLVQFAVDFLISISLWTILYLFKLLTRVLSIDGWPGQLILTVHAMGAAAAFSLFATLFVLDTYRIHQRLHSEEVHRA